MKQKNTFYEKSLAFCKYLSLFLPRYENEQKYKLVVAYFRPKLT